MGYLNAELTFLAFKNLNNFKKKHLIQRDQTFFFYSNKTYNKLEKERKLGDVDEDL